MIRFFLLFLSSSISLFGQAVIPEKVLICGVCRNVESQLPYTMKIMQDIGGLFEDYRIIVYENNSTDRTSKMLNNWMRYNSRVVVKSEFVGKSELEKVIVNLNTDNSFFRPELIARARNIVLDIAMSDLYQKYPYVIWMDMDFKRPPALEGIIETFTSNREWDAVFAYGIDPQGIYWDWYAFRDDVYPIGSELLGNDWWYMPKKFSLNQTNDWYPVISAFGGCGIYKKSSILGCRYSALVTEDLELVAKQLITQGQCDSHPQILKYLNGLKDLQSIVKVDFPRPNLPKVEDPKVGVLLHSFQDPVIWKMSTFVYQYPSVCEHVPFHASMIVNGHGKLFINPRLVFTYGE